jgi:thiol-disulfide isomerase/thioredoxin
MTPSRRAMLAAAGAAAAAAGAGFAWWRGAALAPVPESFWALRLARPEGGELALAEFRGRPLLVNFWATWCPPCVRELPEIDRFARDSAARGVAAVALAVDAPSAVREFLKRLPLSLPVGLCGLEGGEVLRQLGNGQGALPYTVLAGADGAIRQRKLGETSYRELEGWI